MIQQALHVVSYFLHAAPLLVIFRICLCLDGSSVNQACVIYCTHTLYHFETLLENAISTEEN